MVAIISLRWKERNWQSFKQKLRINTVLSTSQINFRDKNSYWIKQANSLKGFLLSLSPLVIKCNNSLTRIQNYIRHMWKINWKFKNRYFGSFENIQGDKDSVTTTYQILQKIKKSSKPQQKRGKLGVTNPDIWNILLRVNRMVMPFFRTISF